MNKRETEQNRAPNQVLPIEKEADIRRLRRHLSTNPRDLLLFDMLTQTGIGMKRLAALRVKDLLGLNPNDRLSLPGVYGRQPAELVMTDSLYATWSLFLERTKPDPGDFVFQSRNGRQPLNLSSISNMVRGWFEAVGLEELSGTRSLKKTWERHFQGRQRPPGEPELVDPLDILKPAETVTLQELVYRELLKSIVSGRIPPGEKLTVEKIASRMKVSPMPVREALARLEATGFIVTIPKKGSIVNELSVDNLKEILAIRLHLEIMAAEKGCQNRTRETIAMLESVHEKYVEAVGNRDVDGVLNMNKQFHHLIYKDAHLPILQQIVESLWGRVSPYLHLTMRSYSMGLTRTESTMFIGLKKHTEILDGMKRKDVDKVCNWLKKDLIEAAEVIINFLDSARNQNKPQSISRTNNLP